MIPILYDNSDGINFNDGYVSQGIGRLDEAISCSITETLMGVYELELEYPVTGRYANELTSGGIISALRPYAEGNTFVRRMEPFEIYRHEIAGDIITVSAHHISYRLSSTIVEASRDAIVPDSLSAFSMLRDLTLNESSYISEGSIEQIAGEFKFEYVKSQREYLYDDLYSFRKVYGCDIWFRGLTAYEGTRGEDRGAEIRYGKNLTDWQVVVDKTNVYNAIVPFWQTTTNGELVIIYSDPQLIHPAQAPDGPVIARAVDFGSYFKDQPSTDALSVVAHNYMVQQRPWEPYIHAEVKFAYSDAATEAPIDLGDIVTVFYNIPELLGKKMRVVEVKYDSILERFDSFSLGDSREGFAVTSAQGLSASRVNYA